MAANAPQAPQKNRQIVLIAAMAAVIVLMATVIIVLVMRGRRSSDAQTAKDTTTATPTPEVTSIPTPSFEDAYLQELREDIEDLRSNMQTYLEGVPEYEAGLVQLEDGKLQLAQGQILLDQGYADYFAEHQAAGNFDQHTHELTDLEEFEAAERELVHGLLSLLVQNPEIAQLLQKGAYFGSSFDLEKFMYDYGSLDPDAALDKALSDPQFFLWEKDYNGNAIILNGQPLLDLDACEVVIFAAQEYLDSFAGYGASKD